MTEPIRDPRLVEIAFLMDLERHGELSLQIIERGGAIARRSGEEKAELYGTDPVRLREMVEGLFDKKLIAGQLRWETDASRLVARTHAGCVHLWNLRDALSRDRLKDPTGILFDGRNLERNLQLALWRASVQEPLAVAFVDMNGLKAINDTVGHEAGDEAVRTYFGVIAASIAELGDAYRVGGDEVVIVLPRNAIADGAKLLGLVLQGLSSQAVIRNSQRFPLSACAGIAAATDPGETTKAVRERADKLLYKAKEVAKQQTARLLGKGKKHRNLAARRLGALAVDGWRKIEEFLPIVSEQAAAPRRRPK